MPDDRQVAGQDSFKLNHRQKEAENDFVQFTQCIEWAAKGVAELG